MVSCVTEYMKLGLLRKIIGREPYCTSSRGKYIGTGFEVHVDVSSAKNRFGIPRTEHCV